MQRYFETLADARGNVQAGLSVLVKIGGQNATIYSDNGTTVQTNPVTSDSSGGISFYAANGTYDLSLVAASGAVTSLRSQIILFDPLDCEDGTPTSSSTVLGETGGVVKRFAVDEVGDAGLRTDLAASTGSSLLGWIRSALGAVETTLAKWLQRRPPSVFDFMTEAQITAVLAGAAGGLDVTAALQAAITHAKTLAATQTEVGLDWPAGAYNVTTLDLVGAERVTMVAEGAVIIYGTQVGGTSVLDVDGGIVTPTRRLDWRGNFSVQMAPGASYQYGVYASYLLDSRWQMGVSGSYSVNPVYINYSWDNPVLHLTAGNSAGTAVATIKCGPNNVNRNHFVARTTGSADMAIASIGFELTGNANVLEGDFSSSQIGIKMDAARGCTIISPYHEINKYCIAATAGNSRGNTIIGGHYEVGSNGAAFDLSSTQNTTVVSPQIVGIGGGANRTAFALGAACYGLSVIDPDIENATIDNAYTGTWRGTGGFAKDFKVLGAQWLAFPATQVSSSNVNTLDDYEEGTWTPTLTTVTPGDLSVAYTTQTGTYTKVGRVVTAQFSIVTSAFTHSTASGAAQISGLPFASAASPNGRADGGMSFGGITKAGYTQVAPHIEYTGSAISLYASGSGVAISSVKITEMPSGGAVELYGSIVYQTAT